METPKGKDINKNTQALLEMARALGASSELDDLLAMVVGYSMELLGAERASLFLYDAEHEELYSRIAEGTGELRFSVKSGLAGTAARELKIINIPDAYQDERFNREVDKKTGYRTRNILSCPLTDYGGKLVGVLQVLNKKNGTFDESDIALAQALSAQAGVALQRAHLIEEYLEKQQLENSMRIAQEIQQCLLPKIAPPLAGFDIACWSRPCDATGGDYCDFLLLDEQRLMVSFGDVTGHGIGPALVSCATRAMLRALCKTKGEIKAIMNNVNFLMTADLPDNRFVTAFLGVLNSSRNEMVYCSAGQGPLLWLHGEENRVEVMGADGIPVGIIADFEYQEPKVAKMELGDVFVLLTDGFYEWERQDGELFGADRAVEVIRKKRACPAGEILDAVREAVENFSDTPQGDDLTAIVIKRVE